MQSSERLPTTICPSCGKELSAASRPNGEHIVPKAGDFSLCAHCAQLFRFTPILTLRVSNEEDLEELEPGELELLNKAREAIKQGVTK